MTDLVSAFNSPIVGILFAQFLVLLASAGYLRRVVRDHDRELEKHDTRLDKHDERIRDLEQGGIGARPHWSR